MIAAEEVDPFNLRKGKRIFKLEVNEDDEISLDITLTNGTIGNLKIQAATLAQIIKDRNYNATMAMNQSTENEIQVGDGMDLDTDPENVSRQVDSLEILRASEIRKRNGS